MARLALLLVVTFMPSGLCGAQVAGVQPDPKPTNCEIAILLLDTAVHKAGADLSIQIIAHRGSRDERHDLIERRLFNIVTYLTDFYPSNKLPRHRLIVSEGAPVDGLGRVDVLAGEHLVGIIWARPGRDIIVGHCDDRDETERKFYPWRETMPIRGDVLDHDAPN